MFGHYNGKIPVLILTGMASGLICGLLGAGGGIVTVFLLRALWGDRAESGGKDIFSATVAVMLPVCAFSAFLYSRTGALPLSYALPYVLPAVLGGLCGAWLLDKIDLSRVRLIFSLLVLYCGITLVARG